MTADITTLATADDARSRLHRLHPRTAGTSVCGSAITRMADQATDGHKKMCFFCAGAPVEEQPAPAPAPVEGESVTIRVAEVLVAYLAQNIGAGFAQAVERAEVRRAGRGATYHLPMGRELAEQVHGHLVERLGHKRTGLGIQRWRAERAVRMIAADLGQDA